VDKAKGTQFLDERKAVIANILNIYFAGLTIEDINSDKDIRRIQYELLEIFNETLYKNSKPLIRQVLFREFGIQ
jgi:flagellar basal body-associated protein FliL